MKRTAIAIAVGALSIGFSQGLLAQDEETERNEQEQMTQEGQDQQTEVRVEGEPADVSVEQKSAEIQVEQQAPDVTVEQQPPKVTIEQPDPNVTVEQAEPDVTVEQTGEVDVAVENAEEVDAEMRDLDAQDQAKQDQQDQAKQDQQDQAKQDTAEASGDQAAEGNNDLINIQISDFGGYTLYSQEDDEEIGDVERVVRDTESNDIYVVITKGGFLGFGKDEMGYRLDDLELRNEDELVVTSSNDGVSGDYSSDQYEDIEGNQTLDEAMQRN